MHLSCRLEVGRTPVTLAVTLEAMVIVTFAGCFAESAAAFEGDKLEEVEGPPVSYSQGDNWTRGFHRIAMSRSRARTRARA